MFLLYAQIGFIVNFHIVFTIYGTSYMVTAVFSKNNNIGGRHAFIQTMKRRNKKLLVLLLTFNHIINLQLTVGSYDYYINVCDDVNNSPCSSTGRHAGACQVEQNGEHRKYVLGETSSKKILVVNFCKRVLFLICFLKKYCSLSCFLRYDD